MFKAIVNITLRPSILDPKGKATLHALHNLGYDSIKETRIGKRVELVLDVPTENEAISLATVAAEKILANMVMEDFTISVEPIEIPA